MPSHTLLRSRTIVALLALLTALADLAAAGPHPVPDPKGTNVTFSIGARRRAWTRANQLAVANEGDFIYANVRIDDELKASADGKDVRFDARLYGGTEALLVEHTWTQKYTGSNPIYVDMVPDPKLPKFPHWTSKFAAGLAQLPAGVHGLTYRVQMTVDGTAHGIAHGVLKYTSKGGQGYAKIVALLATKVGEQAPAGTAKPSSAQGVALHLSSGTDAGAAPVKAFKAGEAIFLHAAFDHPLADDISPSAPATVYFVVYLDSAGKRLGYYSFGVRVTHLHKERAAKQNGAMVVPIVSDPEGICETFGNNLFNSQLPKDLAKLAPGTHEISCRLECSHPAIEGAALAEATFQLTMTADGAKKLIANAAAARQASIKRGGEIVVQGLRLKSDSGFRMVVTEQGRINTTRGGGHFSGDRFYIGLFKVGEMYSDRYQPDGRTGAYSIRRADNGVYEIVHADKVVAKVDKHGKITDAAGKPWGVIYNDFASITAPSGMRKIVVGLYHFSDLFRR